MNQIRSVSVRMDADVASYVAKMKLAGRETEKAFDGASINSRRLNSDLQATEQRLDRVSQAERQVESSTRSASTQLRSMDNDVVRLNRDLDRGGNALDSYSGRVSLLAQAGAVLGPALLPIGAVAVPALTGLATAATAGAVAGGTLLTAMVGVGDAVQAMNDQALDPSRANMEKLRAAMDQLGPEARHFVREFAAFRPVLSDIRDSAAAGWFPGLIESLDDFEGLAPRVADMFEDIGEAGGRMVAETAESFNSQRWIPFLNFVAAELPSALTSLGRIVGDLTHGAAEMWMSFDPANDQFLSWLEGVANGFDNWASSASGREDIAAFLAYVQQTGPQVQDLFLATADALTQITRAAAPLGGPVLEGLTAVAKAMAAIAASDLGTPIFAGIAALSVYNRALATTAALQRSALGVGLGVAPAGAKANRGSLGLLVGTNLREQVAGIRSATPALRDFGTVAYRAGQSSAYASEKTLKARDAVRGFGRAAGPAALPIAGLTLATTGLADSTGLSNTASLALLGTLGGPWGAVIGGAVGLTLDFALATDDLSVALENLAAAASRGSVVNSLASAQVVVDNLGISLDQLLDTNIQDQLFGTVENIDVPELSSQQEIDELRTFLDLVDQVTTIGPALADAMDISVGPVDGSAASFRELEGAIAQAQPRMDELRITFDDLVAASRLQGAATTGPFASFFAPVAGASTALEDLLSRIGEADNATRRYSDTMRDAAQAARQERAALNAATNAMRDKTDAALSAFDAETRYIEALKDATLAGKRNDAGIEGNGKVALANRDRISALAAAWNSQSNEVKNNVEAFRRAKDQFVDTAVAMGVPIQAAKELARELLEIPRSIVAKIEARGAAEAEAEARRVQTALDNIRDRTVTIRTIRSSVAAARDPSFPLATPDEDYATGGHTGAGGKYEPAGTVHRGEFVFSAEATAGNEGRLDRLHRNLRGYDTGGLVGGTHTTYRSSADDAVNDTVRAARDMTAAMKAAAGAAKAETKTRLNELEKRQRALEKDLDQARRVRDRIQNRYDTIAGTVSSRFDVNPFAVDPGLSAYDAGGPSVVRPSDTVRSSIKEIRQFNNVVEQLEGLGLKGAALEQATESASIEQLRALLAGPRSEVRDYVRLLDRQQRLQQRAGESVAEDIVGKRLDTAVDQLRGVRHDLGKVEDAIKHLEDDQRDHPDRVSKGLGESATTARLGNTQF